MKRSIETEQKLEKIKRAFEEELKTRLNLSKVIAPLYVSKKSGLNDNLNGVEKPVSFFIKDQEFEVVHSLAKWKRWYLGQLSVPAGEGIVTDMKAIRVDEVISPIHSHFVDQWDWEKVITKEDRTLATLIAHGTQVYESLRAVCEQFRDTELEQLPHQLKVIDTEELYAMYPQLSAKEREHRIAKEFGAVLLIGIGGKLSCGEEHDLRAPDYDDWSTQTAEGKYGLNADLIVWDSVRELSLEISSMGIRVDAKALEKQLKMLGLEERLALPFHKKIIAQELPLTIGGGIGQSRVAMFVTKEADITQVQPVEFL